MSISTKLTLVVAVLASMIPLGSSLAMIELANRQERRAIRQQAELMSSVLRIAAEAGLRQPGALEELSRITQRAGAQQVAFYALDGRPIALGAAATARSAEQPPADAAIRRVIESESPAEALVRLGDRELYIYRLPLYDERQRVAGALELGYDLRTTTRQRTWLKRGLATAGVLMGVFALLVAAYSRRAIARPIGQLMNGMDHVIRGDLNHVLPLDSTAEIGRIAYRFNEMTAMLRQAQAEIHRNAEAKLQIEGRLRRSEKLAAIGQLSAEIAHEVGTPLNVIGGRARAIQRKAEQAEVVRKNAAIIADQVGRITRIIEQVLDLARAPSPRREPVRLDELIADVTAFLDDELRHAGVEIELALKLALPEIVADADGLQQVLLNLLLNAVQAMPDGGTIEVGATIDRRRKPGLDAAPAQVYAVFSVRDSGPGIAPEHRERIFDPFFSTKTKGEGTGLGLTVVQGIVKAHDGWIEVDDASPRGAIFRVYLPLAGTDVAMTGRWSSQGEGARPDETLPTPSLGQAYGSPLSPQDDDASS